MHPHFLELNNTAFGVCPLALLQFDSNKGQMSPKPTAHGHHSLSDLVATKIIQGLSHARMSHLVFQED